VGTAEPWGGKERAAAPAAPRPQSPSPTHGHPLCTYPLPRPIRRSFSSGGTAGGSRREAIPARPGGMLDAAKLPYSCPWGGRLYSLAAVYWVHTECLKDHKYRFPVFTCNPQQPKRHIFTVCNNSNILIKRRK